MESYTRKLENENALSGNSTTEKYSNRDGNAIHRFKQIRTLQKRAFVSWEIEQ